MENEDGDNLGVLNYTIRPKRPMWLRIGLWGLPNRGSVWICFWIAVGIAIYSVVRSYWQSGWLVGVLMLLAAFWYLAIIRWVDRNDDW